MPTDVVGAQPSDKQIAPSPVVSSPQVGRVGRTISAAPSPRPFTPARRATLFSETLLDMSSPRQPRRMANVTLSIVFHVLILSALLLPPLYFTQTIDLRGFTQTTLVAPLPPPPPPPAQAIARTTPAPRRTFVAGGRLTAPTFIPLKIAMLKEEPLPPDVAVGVVGGVPGGVPGGQLGGVIGGIVSDASRINVPLPAAPVMHPQAPVRVGGRVRPPRVLSKPSPVYPPLAKQTKVQGVVTIDAVIDAEGNVVEMRVVSGHPLLISAALDAVKQRKYEPTYLDDQAIAVQLIVTVTFQLEH